MKKQKVVRGVALLVSLIFAVVLGIGAVAVTKLHSTEISLVRRQNNSTRAFYLAEAGIQKALWVISNHPDWANTDLRDEANRGKHGLDFNVGTITSDASTKTITCSGMGIRQIQIQAQPDNWLNKIPAAVYSNGTGIKIKFDKRDDTYIDGHNVAGIYSTGDVKTKKEGEGRIEGNPAILEYQNVPEGLQDGLWDAFDINTLRGVAKANGTYFQGDDYNKKKVKYTLPVEDGVTDGVFFFDTKDGVLLDDDAIDKKNEANVELKGTTEQISGIIVVLGDLKIVDTKDYDFLFDGVIIVLDDLKIDDKRHHRRKKGTNDSDIFIKGAVLSDDIIQKRKKRKKKPNSDIKNATIEYDAGAITKASSSYWTVIPGTWQEMDISN